MRKLEWFNILPLGLSVFLVISRLLSNPGQFQNKIPLFQTISENRSRNAKKNLTSPNSSLISDTYELRVLIEKEPKIIAEENAVLAVWNQYKSEHSQMAVIRDWEQKERKRKFAIGYYRCVCM